MHAEMEALKQSRDEIEALQQSRDEVEAPKQNLLAMFGHSGLVSMLGIQQQSTGMMSLQQASTTFMSMQQSPMGMISLQQPLMGMVGVPRIVMPLPITLGETELTPSPLHRNSGKTSCISRPDPFEDIEEGTMCSLLVKDPKKHVVAYGKIFKSCILHGKELSPDAVKVSVDKAVDEKALVPCLDHLVDITMVKQAIKGYLTWPNELIEFGLIEISQQPKSKNNVKSHNVESGKMKESLK